MKTKTLLVADYRKTFKLIIDYDNKVLRLDNGSIFSTKRLNLTIPFDNIISIDKHIGPSVLTDKSFTTNTQLKFYDGKEEKNLGFSPAIPLQQNSYINSIREIITHKKKSSYPEVGFDEYERFMIYHHNGIRTMIGVFAIGFTLCFMIPIGCVLITNMLIKIIELIF